MGPARQMSVLLCWVPSERGTILYVCLQERPTRPLEKQRASFRGRVDWTVNEKERVAHIQLKQGEGWVGGGS